MKYSASRLTPFPPTFPKKIVGKRIATARNRARAPAIPLSTFKINTYKSVLKERTLSTSRMNTYEKTGGRGHQLPAIFAPLVYPDLRGATRLPRSSRGHASLPPSYAPYTSRMDLRDAPRSASIPRGLSRLRILPVATGVYPYERSIPHQSSRRLSPLGALCASVAKTSALTLTPKKSIAAQRNARITRSSLRWRLALEHHLDPSLRTLLPLVAFRAGRLAPEHRSLHSVGWPPREAALVRSRRSRHRDPRRHSRVPYAGIAGWRQLPLRCRHRPDEYRLDRRRRRLSLRHLRQHRRFRDHEGFRRRHLLGSPSATPAGCLLLWRVHRGLRGIRF